MEAALAAKSAQLKSHNAMLARLEQCLAQGPAQQRYSKMLGKAEEHEQSLLEAQSQVDARDRQLAEQAEELEQQRDALDTQASELADKEAKLHNTQKHLEEQQSMLETQAHEVAAKEASAEAAIAAKVALGVESRLAVLKAEMEAQSEEKIAAVKATLMAQNRALQQTDKVVLMERRAARIADAHAMRAMTSPSDSYAAASDSAFEESQPMLIETSAHEAPVAPAAAPAANTSVWAQKLASHCAAYSSCDTCGADGRCGWCAGSVNKCLALDVNANLRSGSSSGDGLTSGQCTSDAWQTSVASRLTLLSLNVFASERANSTRRFAAIIQLIKKSSADVIALQEVEKWFVHALQAHSWVKNNYHMSEYGPGQAPGGLYILSRYPIAETNYYENIQPGQVEVSARGRVLVAKLGVKQQAVYVATTALDYRSSENRANSLNFIFRTLKPFRHVFLLGDFNFDEGSKIEAGAVPQSYLDLWPTLVSDRPGFTWDPRSNWFAAASDPQSRASRIDRVYLRSNQWMPRSIHLVGCSVSDPLCGAKNLDVKAGVTLIDANKVNPALILAAPTNAADKKNAAEADWGTKVPAFLEESAEVSFMEMGAEVAAPKKPTFEPDFVPSNHFGLLVQVTQFAPRCPAKEE